MTSWCSCTSQEADRFVTSRALLPLIKCTMYFIITAEEIFVLGKTIFDSNRHARRADKGLYNHSLHSLNPRVKQLTKACVIALLLLSSLLVSIQSLTMVSNHLTEKKSSHSALYRHLRPLFSPKGSLSRMAAFYLQHALIMKAKL